MSNKHYLCKIVGTGANLDEFRPAIDDVLTAGPGSPKAFITKFHIGLDGVGQPLHDWVMCVAKGDNHNLANGNQDIDRLHEPASTNTRLDSLDAGVNTAIMASITARGIDLSWVNGATSWRNVADYMIQQHAPGLNIDDLDLE